MAVGVDGCGVWHASAAVRAYIRTVVAGAHLVLLGMGGGQ